MTLYEEISNIIIKYREDPYSMLSSVINVLIKATYAEGGLIILLKKKNEEIEELKIEVADGVPPLKEIEGKIINKNEYKSTRWETLLETPEELINIKRQDPDYVEVSIYEEFQFRIYNSLSCGIKIDNKVYGLIELLNKPQKEGFTKEDENFLKFACQQLGYLFNNMFIIKSLEEKIKELNTLLKVSNIISSNLRIDELLKVAMEAISKVTKSEASSIMLLDEEKKELVFKVALGEKAEALKEIRVPLGRGIAGHVAQTKKPEVVQDVEKNGRFYKEVDEKTKFKTRSICCVPIMLKEKLIGVVEILNKIANQPYTQDDVELLMGVANQLGIAIENARLYEEMEDLFISIIMSLTAAIDAKDPYTHGHSKRVMEYALIIGKELGLDKEQIEILRLSALLHDIGKIGVPERVLCKPGRLTEEEYALIKNHPNIGAGIIRHIKKLNEVIKGVVEHHERYDGKGYPLGLNNDEISIYGRIIAVADAFDAMTSDRPYRKALSDKIALNELKYFANSQFDEKVVTAFINFYKRKKMNKKNE